MNDAPKTDGKYTVLDNIEKAEDEFENFAYSVCLVDSDGEVRGVFVDEELAAKVAELLNNNA